MERPKDKGIPAGASYISDQAGDTSEEEESSEEEASEEEAVDNVETSKEREEANSDSSDQEELPEPSLAPGTLVAAVYEGELFVAEVMRNQAGVKKGYTKLSYTTPRGINVFSWPEKVDPMVTLNEDILIQPITVEPINSRGHLAMAKKVFERAK